MKKEMINQNKIVLYRFRCMNKALPKCTFKVSLTFDLSSLALFSWGHTPLKKTDIADDTRANMPVAFAQVIQN